MIQRQVQQRMLAAQLLLPVIQLSLTLSGFQPGTLPDRVICVLNRQRGQIGGMIRNLCLIQLHELANQQFAGPAIRYHVVHAHRQHVLGVIQAEQLDPQQRAAHQVERRVQLDTHLRLQHIGFDVHALEGDTGLRQHLVEFAILGDEPGAQGFMALHQVIERLAECLTIQRAVQAYRQRHVVGNVVRLQLPEKQHTLLGVRQRNACGLMPGYGNRQQPEALPGLVHLVEDQTTLFDGQTDEALGDTRCCRLVHVRYPPFRSSFFRYRTSRPRSATGRSEQKPG
ncbi:hypothetical protein PSFL111601_27995 [Pseudomonas floridensis]